MSKTPDILADWTEVQLGPIWNVINVQINLWFSPD